MDSVGVLETKEQLQALQWRARHQFQATETARPLTAPRLLSLFLESRLPELDFNSDCSRSHEMQLVSTQSSNPADGDQPVYFLSTICSRCHYHFHVRSSFQHIHSYNEKHRQHMLISCPPNKADGLSTTPAYDDTISDARYICAFDSCYFTVHIYVIPPRLSPDDVIKIKDRQRTIRNLEIARSHDPNRYLDMPEPPSIGIDTMLRRYLSDALARKGQALKINKRNKKFLVLMGNDFDTLLRFLGFYEEIDPESLEACWYIPPIDSTQSPTPIRTLRARVEDALTELNIISNLPMTPAWDRLLQVFQGDYPSVSVDNYLNELDLILLGCLPNYPPGFFSWAATVLAEIRPRDRNKYLDIGLRCINNRSEEASTEIILYKSQFDGAMQVDMNVQEAYAFFDASLDGGMTSEWFLDRYQNMIDNEDTDEFKTRAQQHLGAVGRYLGQDLLSVVNPNLSKSMGDFGLMASSGDASARRMSVTSAATLLNIEPNYTPEIIRGFVQQKLDNDNVDQGQVIEAVDVLSEYKRREDHPEEAAELQETIEFIKASGPIPALRPQPHASPQPATSLNTPPGLRNIGNTCYLNSLLQYFYNVKLIRDLVLGFDEIKLELDEDVVKQRRTGGNGTSVNLEEAIVARQFVEMLQGLFADLESTSEQAAQPSQKLANTALSSAREILEQQPQNVPPPLPARPSPAPPVVDGAVSQAPMEMDKDAVNITVESVNDKLELASSRSSQTLVDEADDVTMSYIELKTPDEKSPVVVESNEDVTMQDSADFWTLDAKVAEVSRRLEHSDRSGTSQQDVSEIIGNILEHFMRAIRADGPMPDNPKLQSDKITQAFFTTIVNCTIKTKKSFSPHDTVSRIEESPLNVEIVPERWITAYPEEADQASEGINTQGAANNVSCTLYEALDRYFSYEPFDDGNRARYSSIRTLPPILHICIQRSTPKGKNKNPVILPEDLFLDRYMESEKDSPVWLARKRAWALKERLKELKSKPSDKSSDVPEHTLQGKEAEFKNKDVSFDDQSIMALASLGDTPEEAQQEEELRLDTGIGRKRKVRDLSESLECVLAKKIIHPNSSAGQTILVDSLSDRFSDMIWETSEPLRKMVEQETLDLRQKEEAIFDSMTNEKYSIHAVICHRGGTAAGHYWVWIRDFRRNVWYRYNDETVTEDGRGTEAVLKDLNETGDPYYVAYVRDELREELVDVPPRRNATQAKSKEEEQEVEAIQGLEVDPSLARVANGNFSG
ncbi:hypothetical protein M426DRAFT_25139 [Hypoxylon sp. CI-4A]|nr:hypothetical protein M426DRAFT_25139 [Hypoxylon sp. CI-4A]